MELRGYLTAIRRGWWIIAVCLILGVGGGALLNFRATPIYAAHVQFWVKTNSNSESASNAYSAEQFAQARAVSYAALLSSSDTLAKMVKSTGKIDLAPAAISAEMSGTAQLNTLFVNAQVLDPVPARALAIAKAASTQLPKIADGLTNTAGQPAEVQLIVTSSASVGAAPISPRKTLNLTLGLLGGIALGLVLAVVRFLVDTSIRTTEEVEQEAGAPLLTTIGFDPGARANPLLIGPQAQSPRAEALRRLRTNLQFMSAARPLRSLVLTSATKGEGKSLTAVNLAIVSAASGSRVLLIDGDLRCPRIADYLSLDAAAGLSNVLAGQAAVAEVVQRWGRGGLHVLTSGPIPPNPVELLGGDRFADLLEQAYSRYDLIVIDAPPSMPVTDAALLAGRADGVLIVFRFGKTTRAQLAYTVRALDVVGARKVGVVSNMKPVARSARRGGLRYGEYVGSDEFGDMATAAAETGSPRRRRGRPAPGDGQAGGSASDAPDSLLSRF